MLQYHFILFNPCHAGFLKWNNPPSFLGTGHYHSWDINMSKNLKNRALSDCTCVQVGLALYWRQRLWFQQDIIRDKAGLKLYKESVCTKHEIK